MTSQSFNTDLPNNNKSIVISGKKILQVLPNLNQGGVERGTLEVAQAIIKAGGLAYIACNGGTMLKNLSHSSIHFMTLPLHSKNPYHILCNIFRLYRLIKRHRIDLIHTRSRAPAWSAWVAARLAKIPFVTTFHGTYNFKTRVKKFYNAIMVRGDRVIAISPFIERHIRTHYTSGSSLKNLTVIPRGVDITLFNPSQSDLNARQNALKDFWRLNDSQRPFILLPARLTRWKGQEVALQALTCLPNFSGTLILLGSDQGRAQYSADLKQQAARAGLSDRVCFVSHCADMPAAYALADVVLHTSIEPEGFGRVIIEAQAMEKCVIATNHGAPQDIVLNGKTGYLVSPHDPQQLSATLSGYFALDISEKTALSQRALARVQTHFSLTQMLTKTLEVYHSLLYVKDKMSETRDTFKNS